MEINFIPPNTLVVTNSKALFDVLKPDDLGYKRVDRQTFLMPPRKDFMFFGFDEEENGSNTKLDMHTAAHNLFSNGELIYGFYPLDKDPEKKFTSFNNQPCASKCGKLETIIQNASNIEPIYIAVLNMGSLLPVEVYKCEGSHLKYNYLDVKDPSNAVFSNYIHTELGAVVLNSRLITSYFGEDTLQASTHHHTIFHDPYSVISPLKISFRSKTNEGGDLMLGGIDLFINFGKNQALQAYFTPLDDTNVSGWLGPQYFNPLYTGFYVEPTDNSIITVFLNTKRYPTTESIFSQPFTLEVLNFGRYNYLHSTEVSTTVTDLHQASRVLAFLRYNADQGAIYIIII